MRYYVDLDISQEERAESESKLSKGHNGEGEDSALDAVCDDVNILAETDCLNLLLIAFREKF
jgi:hypothetical protein